MRPPTSTRRRHSRGMVLYEMLIAVALAAMAMNMAMRLFDMIVRSYRDAPAAAHELQLQAQSLDVMRDDAWRATAVTIGDDHSLTLRVGERSISWRQDEAALVREGDGEPRRWPRSRPLRWSIENRIVTVSDADVRIPLATPARDGGTR